MKAIVTQRREDGSYDEVGTNNRRIVDGKSLSGMHRRMKHWTWMRPGAPYRMEIFYGDTIHKDKPDKVMYYGSNPMRHRKRRTRRNHRISRKRRYGSKGRR